MNLRLYKVFHVKDTILNITHTEAMRIKTDHGIITKIEEVACIIAAIL